MDEKEEKKWTTVWVEKKLEKLGHEFKIYPCSYNYIFDVVVVNDKWRLVVIPTKDRYYLRMFEKEHFSVDGFLFVYHKEKVKIASLVEKKIFYGLLL